MSLKPVPEHDGKVLLVAEDGVRPAEHMSRSDVDKKVSDFYGGIAISSSGRSMAVSMAVVLSRSSSIAHITDPMDDLGPPRLGWQDMSALMTSSAILLKPG